MPFTLSVMNREFDVKTSVTIKAPVSDVWRALTQPDLISQYLAGSYVSSRWRKNSFVIYRGVYQGRVYYERGLIKEIEPGVLLQISYPGPKRGLEKLLTYTLQSQGNWTILTVTQENNTTALEQEYATKNWEMVLLKLKEVTERHTR